MKSSKESNCTQNSGVVVMTTTNNTNMHDNDLRKEVITYYRVIKDIIELSFNEGRRKIVLFECDWVDNNKNKIDKHGFTLVHVTKPNKKTCPFILPSLVLQAFFVPDPLDKPWVVTIVTKPKDTFDLSTEGKHLKVMPIQSDPNVSSTSTDCVDPIEE